MKVVDGKMVRNKRNTFEPAKTKGVRLTVLLWDRIKTQAEREELNTNALITRTMDDYCTEKESENEKK